MAQFVKLSENRWMNLDHILTVFDSPSGMVRVKMVGEVEASMRGEEAETLLSILNSDPLKRANC